jgi:hypothetical protein
LFLIERRKTAPGFPTAHSLSSCQTPVNQKDLPQREEKNTAHELAELQSSSGAVF